MLLTSRGGALITAAVSGTSNLGWPDYAKAAHAVPDTGELGGPDLVCGTGGSGAMDSGNWGGSDRGNGADMLARARTAMASLYRMAQATSSPTTIRCMWLIPPVQ